MPRWSELKRFCLRDDWELYKDTDHYYFRKKIGDETLYTRVSKESGEIKQSTWKQILNKQLRVSQEYFNKMI